MPHSVAVFGAAGYTGALAARLLTRHPAFELRRLTARTDVGRRLDDLYPHHRVPLSCEELDLDRHAEVDAARRRLSARRRRASSSPSCASAASRSSI